MKIWTVTFQRTTNCGAALQAYALTSFLRDNGYEATILDYCPQWVQQQNATFKNLFASPSLKKFVLYPYHTLVNSRFKKFVRDYCCVTPVVKNIKDIHAMEACDVYITGSDQVWNPEITNGVDDVYLLRFPTSASKIAYAASGGNDNLTDKMLAPILETLKDYKAISVREHVLELALKSRGIKNITAVWDPVFLLDREKYIEIQKPTRLDKYVLIYTKHKSADVRKLAKRVADHKGLHVVDMSKIIRSWPADKTRAAYGPREFLGLFFNASYVITNSFHGTAFSLIFQKNFYTLEAEDKTSRITSLLSDIGLQNRLVWSIDELKEITDVDYNACKPIMDQQIAKSKAYLLDACRMCEQN